MKPVTFKVFCRSIVYFGMGCLLSYCSQNQEYSGDPKGRLTEYISKSFSVKSVSDRNGLMTYLTADVKSRFASWSDDQFREAFVEAKREFLNLMFLEVKTTSPSEIQITYQLVYMDKGKGRDGKIHEAKVTNKKLCQMTLSQGEWLISDVRNIKELVEYQNEMSLP